MRQSDSLPALGELEEMVLLATAAAGEEAYGLSVQQLLASEGRRSPALATVHATLYRLEGKGFLVSRMGGATAERGGRSKRFFRVTSLGMDAVTAKRAVRSSFYRLIPDFG
jgi:PadR family transcriptional regulator